MAKIAVESKPISSSMGDEPKELIRHPLARAHGWSVSHVICSAGPKNRPFEEQHSGVCVAIVTSGSFQYRSSAGRELMTPGSLLLGNPQQYFECAHEHGVGDRCLSFAYELGYLDSLAADAGVPIRGMCFSRLRVPPVRELSRVIARACAGLAAWHSSTAQHEQVSFWEEVGLELVMQALEFASGDSNRGSSAAGEARVTRIVRMIESRPAAEYELGSLAREAKLSRYHFLRLFQRLTGLTPHQYILRTRLRSAATRLLLDPARVLDIALDSGFGDVSNFNHAFRAEFGVSPRSYRRSLCRQPAV